MFLMCNCGSCLELVATDFMLGALNPTSSCPHVLSVFEQNVEPDGKGNTLLLVFECVREWVTDWAAKTFETL